MEESMTYFLEYLIFWSNGRGVGAGSIYLYSSIIDDISYVMSLYDGFSTFFHWARNMEVYMHIASVFAGILHEDGNIPFFASICANFNSS